MAELGRSFATYIVQFARTVDIVDDRTWEELRKLITRYAVDDLKMDYFEFVREAPVDDGSGRLLPGLASVWTSEGAGLGTGRLLRTPTNEYNGHAAYVFATGNPLWVVGENEEPLEEATGFIDLWKGETEIPRYAPVVDGMRVSILVPIFKGRRVLGVLGLESRSCRRPSRVGRAEIRRLAEALGTILELHEAHATQVHGTDAALEELSAILARKRFPTRLSIPQLFFASSSRADDDVVEAITSVVQDRFADHFELVHWPDISLAGNITTQTLEAISAARFGICYISEPAPAGAETRYWDNPNVIFEAGMLHAYTNTEADEPRYWIPIREAQSPPMPFDFAAQRTVLVPRLEDGTLEQVEFRNRLAERLAALIDEG